MTNENQEPQTTNRAGKSDCLPRFVLRALWDFRFRHRVESPEEVEPTDVPGYWRFRKACKGECQMGHTAPMQHTLSFTEHGIRDDRGRWVDPFRAWKEWRQFFSQNTEVTCADKTKNL